MCIIVYKPKNQKVSKGILKNCFTNNPDGAGFMYPVDGKVFISKGYMDFDSLWTDVSKIPTEYPIIYHFRIRTHGAKCKELCHPYPITTDYNLLHAHNLVADFGVAHNGVFYDLPSVQGESDTTIFIANVLTPLKKLAKHEKSTLCDLRYNDLLDFACGSTSRLALMDPDGNVSLRGHGWVSHEGCHFSNTSYVSYKTTYKTYSQTSMCTTSSTLTEMYELLTGSILLDTNTGELITLEKDSEFYVDLDGLVYKQICVNGTYVYRQNHLQYDWCYKDNYNKLGNSVERRV